MHSIKSFLIFLVAFSAAIVSSRAESPLEAGFASPPAETKPWCYWYWTSDNISRTGITHDLEAMARVGIGEAFIGNVDVNDEPAARGTVKVLSEDWWQLMEHAVREGKRTGVNIGVFNSPGWSQSGGPWVKQSQTMRYVVSSETRLQGPQAFAGKLSAPKENFQDIAVLAFPAPQADADTLAKHSPRVTSTPAAENIAQICDGNPATAFIFPGNTAGREPFVVDLEVAETFTARALVLHPAAQPFAVDCELQAADDAGQFQTIRKFNFDRSNPGANIGPMVFGPVAITFPPVKSKHFRVMFSNLNRPGGFAEIEISSAARLERFVEKQLGKMWPTPLPLWNAYLWPVATEPDDAKLAINSRQVLNLSDRLNADGTLRWNVPPGEWIVLRTGMAPTGVTNAPASPEGSGPEIDKMNRELVAYHFNQFIGKLLARVPAADRTALKHAVADSYEQGSENWTDGFGADFKKRYGYDPLRWLPVLTGRIVDSADMSDRFLWDLRRLVADRISSDYVGGLSAESRKNGMRMWLENYGHWGFPGEFLQYGGHCDDISGEYWTGGDLGSIELRAASSAAHIYGKQTVTAESWTSGGPHWTLDPWALRQRGDWSFTEGVNHVLLHVYIQQPFDDRIPGVNAGFGTEFNRHNTWFNQAGDWIKYLERSTFLLQQGKHVADVAYFIGEDTPKMTGVQNPPLPPGRDFDYINAEVIEQRLQVKDGKFVLPDGMSYRVLVLPQMETMRPELLKKIRALVKAGGVILGPRPLRSPSLENFPTCDRDVQKLAAEIWQNCDGTKATRVKFGKGQVFCGVDLPTVFEAIGSEPDIVGIERKNFPWIHRVTDDTDIYFISNQSDAPQNLGPTFRVAGRQPELWDAVAGSHRDLTEFSATTGGTVVPLQFAPRQSLFVVFRHPTKSPVANSENFPALQTVGELSGAWTVAFDPKWGGPASVVFDSLTDWTKRPEAGIKFYSGTAKYRKSFDLPAGAGGKLFLDLGELHNLARVRLNGQDLGLVWTAPWRVDISRAVKPAGNELELDVVNTWANRIIGDLKLPPAQRLTWTVKPHFNADSPLLPAGLVGPVTLQRLP
jgi:hypothetical protein